MSDDTEESGFEETLELLREAHREPIQEAHYAAVRARVLAQIMAERRPWWRGVWVYASAAMAVILLLTFWPKHSMPKHAVDRQPVIQAAKQAVESTPEDGARASSVAATRRPRVRRAHPQRQVSTDEAYQVIGPPNLKPLVVKLITDDPNIVIYWISGE